MVEHREDAPHFINPRHNLIALFRYFWYIPGTDTNEMGKFQGEDEFGAIDVERLVHFERNTTENGIQLFEMKSCLIPKCVLANGAYAVLMSNSKQVKLAENTLTIRDDFIFFEKAKGKN